VPCSPKVYTFQTLSQQQEHMWSNRRIADEVELCNRRNLLDIMTKYLPKSGRIIEAGCGLCAWLIKLRDLGYEIEGLDFDPDVVARVREYDPVLTVSEQDVTATKYGPETFDAYISLGVVEHFEEGPQQALQEAHRIMKTDGILVLTVPYNNFMRRLLYNNLRVVFTALLKLRKRRLHFAEYRYNRKEIENYITMARFRIIETGFDDFISPKESMGLWTDWPFLRSPGQFVLNRIGRMLSACLPKGLHSSGIYVVARKTR